MKSRDTQRGASLLFILFIVAILAYTIFVGLKLVPVYMRFESIKKSIDAIAMQMQTKNMTKAQFKDFLERRLDTNYVNIRTLNPIRTNCKIGKDDLLIYERTKKGTSIGIVYNETIPLFANLSASMDFDYKTSVDQKNAQ